MDMATVQASLDAFHRGAFFLKQPTEQGHRAGIDAMLLAALVAKNVTGRLVDLGAGAGAAGLAVAYRSNVDVLLVEQSDLMVDFARESLALKENQAFAERCKVLHADVELSGQSRIEAGLPDDQFDHVIMNPPFNESGDRVSTNELKAKAHSMSDDLLFDKWIKTAASIAKPHGQLSLIARPSSLYRILSACEGRFGGLEITNVQARSDEPAIRLLITGLKGSKARTVMRSAIILHPDKSATDGRSYTEFADELINGLAFWERLS